MIHYINNCLHFLRGHQKSQVELNFSTRSAKSGEKIKNYNNEHNKAVKEIIVQEPLARSFSGLFLLW